MVRRDYDEDDDSAEEEEVERGRKGGRGGKGGKAKASSSGGKKRGRHDFIDETAIEGDEEEEEEEVDEDEEDYDGGQRGSMKKKLRGSQFFELEAEVDDEEEEEEDDEGEDGFNFIDEGADIGEEPDRHAMRRPAFIEEQEEDVDEIERKVKERYARSNHMEYFEDATDVEQQALLPSVKDPKLWMVKCAIGHEREVAICLMQKFIDRCDLQIRSVIALDQLKNYIYVEAEKEAHVKEACKGLRSIYSSAKITPVPIKEMTGVLSTESKVIDLAIDVWVRMKLGIYKGDLAKVVDVDNVRQRATVKLIPRVDLQMIASKLQNAEMLKKKAFLPPPRFFNKEEARELKLRVERKRGESGEIFDCVEGLMFKDGFLYKTVSTKSISVNNIRPTFDELDKFRKPGEDTCRELASTSTLFANSKKCRFMKGDVVIVVRGELKNLKGWVEKVEEDIVHIKTKMDDLPETLACSEADLCKFFNLGDHVKVISGAWEGATGMVVKVNGRVLSILSDTTKEHICVFADHVVESSETIGIAQIGDYELHDLVLLDNLSFGIIIRVEKEAFQVLKGIPDRLEVVLVKLREIKNKIEKRTCAQDRNKNPVSTKDIVRVVEGPLQGKQGRVEHIYNGILFIHDRHHLEHSGFICPKAQCCVLVGGSYRGNGGHELGSRFGGRRSSSSAFQSQGARTPGGQPSQSAAGGRFGGGGRGHGNELVGKSVRIKSGHFKGYKGRVADITGIMVRVELDCEMRNITVKRDEITDAAARATTTLREPRYSLGSETPIHPSRTPLRSFQTPMRDPGDLLVPNY